MCIMKGILHLFQIIKNRLLIVSFILLLFVMIARIAGSSPAYEKNPKGPIPVPSIEYLEDASGTMSLDKVQIKEIAGSFLQHTGSTLSIGQSRSTWWVRMKLDRLPIDDNHMYLVINNPTVEKAVLYLPVITDAGIQYRTLRSGWGFHGNTQDEGLTYPVFRLAENMAEGKYVYLQLSSPFTQNYNIKILTDREFNISKLRNILVLGIFFGLLLAMGINNFNNFLFLKDKAYLYYVIYILSMLVYQASLLGVYRIFMGGYAEALIANVVTLGLFMVAAALMFFRSFLDTPESFPTQDKYSRTFIILCIIGIVMMLSGLRYETSIFSTVLASGAGLLIVYTTVLAVGRGVKQAKYFLAGWGTMLLGLMIFLARVWGMVPNNDLSLLIVMISAVLEAVLLSAALADRVKVLRNEKENALMLYKSAEEVSIANESAFLQAQIKPHFLYNSLNIIVALCRIDACRARELILDLSSYLRHTFDFKNLAKYITFDEELEYIQAYVRIEQARFRDKLEVKYELDDTEELRLPPLILQPLVENAIRHGIRKSDGGGMVALRVKNLADCFIIEVEDDGAGMTENQIKKVVSGNPAAGSGVGLANIQRRLQTLYGTRLSIESRPGEGTKITVIFPKRKENSDESYCS